MIRSKPSTKASCHGCGDSIRDAVGNLAKFLKKKGLYPTLPRRSILNKMSPSQLEELFATHE
jgi:hypothetical protein